MGTLKLELKRLSISTRLSEETIAFAADVWVDGKKVGTAKNDGHGGSTFVDVDAATRARLNEYGKSLMPEEYKHIGGDEYAVDQIVEATLQAKEDKRYAKSIAKQDAKWVASCAARKTHAARYEVLEGSRKTTHWMEFRAGETVARKDAEAKYPTLQNWTVIA